jgi:hypothetical protein
VTMDSEVSMYCEYCDGLGVRYSRREGASINEPPYTTECWYCMGTGHSGCRNQMEIMKYEGTWTEEDEYR